MSIFIQYLCPMLLFDSFLIHWPGHITTDLCASCSPSTKQNHNRAAWLGFWDHLMIKCATAAAKSLQSCPTLCDPRDGSPPGSPSLGFSRQEHWSGLPFPSPVHESEKWKWSCSVVPNSQRPHGLQPTGLLRPWDFPGKSAGVGCHCLLQTCHMGTIMLAHCKPSNTRFHHCYHCTHLYFSISGLYLKLKKYFINVICC